MTEQELIKKIKYCYYDIRKRVYQKNHKDYLNYGGRGIELRFSSWQEFYHEVKDGCFKGGQIDRINVDGHYESGNLRWITCLENRNNLSKFKNGVTKTRKSWQYGIYIEGCGFVYLGCNTNKKEAIQKFRQAHVEWYGEKIYKKVNGKYEKIFK